MKLYVSPAACSMSCHIAMEESKLPFEAKLVAFDNEENCQELERLNPQGKVPVLILDDRKIITQNLAILNYIAEQTPNSGLLPAAGSLDRTLVFQWTSWVAADLHMTLGQLFDRSLAAEQRNSIIADSDKLLTQADKHLDGRTFLVGNQLTIADCYLFTVYSWCQWVKMPTEKYRNLNAFSARMAERPSVMTVMKREGLLE